MWIDLRKCRPWGGKNWVRVRSSTTGMEFHDVMTIIKIERPISEWFQNHIALRASPLSQLASSLERQNVD